MPFFTAADGCRIHYETSGAVGPCLILIPGLGGDGRFWSGVVRLLEVDHRVIVTDHRGAGRSDRPQSPYSIPLIARDIAGLLARTSGPAHIVGHSTGGAIAQVLALDHAELGLSYTISSSWARADARFRALFTARAELLEAGMAETYQRLGHVLCYEPSYLETHAGPLEAAVAASPRTLAPLAVSAARVRMLLDHDRLADLPDIAVPVQVIAAAGDILTPPALSQSIATAIPQATYVTVGGAHFHPLADPEGFAAIVHQFIAEADRKS
ncbi:alpha/beta hydrolase [Mesorhizobium sp.]|uniref:alpha/beta fold hydrolase n=1 Tax=Mesorhizobium sp. TaxID=1871066 RepID=UPI0011F97A90|nr:alpha/beta hydrolase [Mesorhizobium sp.]TIO09384.1 MAG: alpha/beta fold hydrolase [Mesorhizobium sp.]TIO33293.1 MAG: alpha/beta fold hydrolase [Mesorhizobium sp.]TIP08907.1 MAG: alpha/beta fold hydrolase [Mesorhizobium sp.]